MKKICIVLQLSMLMLLCFGCGNYAKKYDANTMIVNSDGSIVEVAVEDYSKTKIKAEDLTEYIVKQIDTYNEDNGGRFVKKKKLLTEDMKKVKLVLRYYDIDAYNAFNLLECTSCNYADADKELFSGKFVDADGKSVKKSQFENVDKAKVLVTTEPTDIVVPRKVLYYNKEVTVKDGKITASGNAPAVIIYK